MLIESELDGQCPEEDNFDNVKDKTNEEAFHVGAGLLESGR